MAARTTYIHVQNPETQGYEVFAPADKLPSWASKALKSKGVKFDDDEDEGIEEAAAAQAEADAKAAEEAAKAAEEAAKAEAEAKAKADADLIGKPKR